MFFQEIRNIYSNFIKITILTKSNMQILEYNPVFNSDLDPFHSKPKSSHSLNAFRSLSFDEMIEKYQLEKKLKNDYLSEFVDFKDFNFLSFPDNVYILGLSFMIDSLERLNSEEDPADFLFNHLKSLFDSSGFFNTICHKLLGKPFTMLFIEEIKNLYYTVRGDFQSFLSDPLKYKEQKMCEVLMRILSYEKITQTMRTKPEIQKKISKIEEYILSEKKEFIEFETRFILEAFCDAFFVNLMVLTIDSRSGYKIIENFQNEGQVQKNIVIFNDSIYLLEKSRTKPEKITIETPPKPPKPKSFIEKSNEKLINEPRKKSMNGEKFNNLLLTQSEATSNSNEKNDKKLLSEPIIPQKPAKTLCAKCAGQVIVDDYNKLSIYFLINCEGCQDTICSVHKESFKKCVCFCKKCENRTEKRYYYKRSADFGFGDDCYEIMECKKCKTLNCLNCEKKMESYEDICDCQCTVCAKKILMKFQNGKKLEKCRECQTVCKKCMVKTLHTRKCEKCGENYCRSCFNEILIAVKGKKTEETKKNGKSKGKNEPVLMICGFCEENKKNAGKNPKEKGFFDRLF